MEMRLMKTIAGNAKQASSRYKKARAGQLLTRLEKKVFDMKDGLEAKNYPVLTSASLESEVEKIFERQEAQNKGSQSGDKKKEKK